MTTSHHPDRRRLLTLTAVAPLVALPWTATAAPLLVAPFITGRAGTATMNHDAFDALLARRTSVGRDGIVRVSYASWAASAADRAALKAYVDTLAATTVSSLSRPEQFAFWANLYNAVTIQVVLDNWPVKSIRDIRSNPLLPGPWKQKLVTVGGTALSLDDIEHGILRKAWKDPRVHYAVNCASYSCPNLPRKALRGATLDRDLDAAARAYVNHPRGATVTNGVLTVSSIYTWYKVDFGNSDAGILAHLRRYADEDLKAALAPITRVSRNTYDWSLNAV